MRNLLEYPVSTEEIVRALSDIAETFDPELVGDMRPTLVEEAIRRIEASADLLDFDGLGMCIGVKVEGINMSNIYEQQKDNSMSSVFPWSKDDPRLQPPVSTFSDRDEAPLRALHENDETDDEIALGNLFRAIGTLDDAEQCSVVRVLVAGGGNVWKCKAFREWYKVAGGGNVWKCKAFREWYKSRAHCKAFSGKGF